MSSLRIASYNASGLLSKLDFTHQLMRDNAIDILLVQETYFTETTDLPDSPFLLTHLPFARAEGGHARNPHGLAILVGERLLPFKEGISIDHRDEFHQASITIRLSNITVSNIYLPPSMSKSQWTATVLRLPTVATNQMHLIMGDWNIRLAGATGDRTSNVRAPAFRKILNAKGWAVVPFASAAPSFDDGRRTSKPDFAVCPSIYMSRCSGVKVLDRDNGGSDHFPILVEISNIDWSCMPAGARRIAFNRLATNQHIRSSFSKLAHRDLAELARRTSRQWQDLLCSQQALKSSCVQDLLDTCTAELNARLISAAERTVGYRKSPTVERYTFKDAQLKALGEARKGLLRMLSVFRQTPVVRADLRKQLDHVNARYKGRIKELALLAKQKFYDSLERKPMHEQLRIARFEANRRQRSGARLLSSDHIEEYADHFAKMFAYREQFRYAATEAVNDTSQQTHDAVIVPTSQQEYEAYSPYLSAAAMALHIRRAPTGKAAGCSAVPAELLKPVAKSAAQVLSVIAEIMVRCGACPTAFKRANIVPVPKKAASADIKSYRPISLTEVPRRIIEKGFSAILLPFQEKLSPMQGGFRQRRSTVDQAAVLHQVVCQRLREPTVLAFLDIRAAYDSVDRAILWQRCLSAGMPTTIVSVLRAMFDENQSRVVLDGACSRWFNNHVGLLQGSSLSPLLYAIFIDELAIQLQLKMPTVRLGDMDINSTLYADDIALIAASIETCQSMLDLCHVFARENHFEFGAQKCEILTARLPRQEAPLKLGVDELAFCSRFKYLGISFGAQGIDATACVESLCKAIVGATAMLKSIGCRPSRYPLHILANLFKAFVRSCGEYAITVLPLRSAHIKLLEQAQYKAVKMLLGSRASISRLKLLAVLGLETVQLRRNILSARWLHATTAKPASFLVKHALIDFERKKQKQSCFYFPAQVNPAYKSFTSSLAEDPSIELVPFLRHYRSQIASKIAMDTGLIPVEIANLANTTNTTSPANQQNTPIAKLLYRLGIRKGHLKLAILWITGCLPYAALPCRICGKDISKAHAEACVLSSALREVGAHGPLGTRLDNSLLMALARRDAHLVRRLVDMLSITLKQCFPDMNR